MLTLLFALVVHYSYAQEKTLTGTVSDPSGLPLPGVNVVVENTTNGTQTDFDGKYSITANEGDILVFSYVGFATQEITVSTGDVIDVQLSEDAAQLDEVIVTAQGIKREKKSLGYAVSTVEEEQINQKAEADIGRILQGKAAGVNITATNGLSGSGTNIIIRGYSSVTGSNQPLFIVDGVPFNSDTNTQTSFLDNGTESSRFLDLDPNTIESVNVLKGLSATTLYGQAGSNGVILITTKNGSAGSSREKFEVTLTQSIFNSRAILPKYQDNYGGGFHQDYGFFFSNWGPSFNADLSANPNFIGVAPNGITLVNGPLGAISDQSLIVGFEDQVDDPYEYRPYDSVEDFFKTGFTSTTSVNVSGGSENTRYNMSYTHFDDEGVTPGNSLTRNNFGIGGSSKLSNKLTVSGVLNFVITDFKSPPVAPSFGSGTGFGGGSIFGDLLYTPRSVNLFGLPFQAQDGRSVYYRSGNDIQNPRWTAQNARFTQEIRRVFGNMSVTYDIKDWLDFTYRIGIDQYTEGNAYGQNRGGVDGQQLGIYRTSSVTNTIWDHTLLFSSNVDLTEDWNLTSNLGFNPRYEEFAREGVESIGQLAFGVLEHFNFSTQSNVNSFTNLPIGLKSVQNTIGAYADATFSFREFLYFNASARNDWSSTLEAGKNSQFYPGVSVSFIPTTAFDGVQSDLFNYMKIRFGYGSSAGFPFTYATRNVLDLSPRGFVDRNGNVVPTNTVASRLGNPDLEPELVSEFEAGIDTRFFNRLNFNASVFKKRTTDLLTDQALDFATGYTVQLVNIGEIETEGIELDFSLDAIKPKDSEGFSWNISGNFYADENTVIDLGADVEQIVLTNSVTGQVANYAVEDRPYGIFLGSTVAVDPESGERLVDDSGNYIINEDLTEIGDPNPDWTSNLNTNFSYKGFSFYMDWQYRHGGDIYSTTTASLIGRGVVDADNPLNREATYVLPGVRQVVDADGTTSTVPNDIQITATNLGFQNYGFGANEFKIFDGSTLRLNEISVGYAMPAKFLDNTPFGSLSIKFSGFNMWYKAFNFPDDVRFDTNSLSTGVGNGLGIDFITGPSVRRYGLSVQATF